MLTILLPIYNFDVRELVKNLYFQAEELNIDFEIIAVDDASTEKNITKNNKEIEQYPSIKFIQLQENFGWRKIRNYLFSLAKHNILLFIDCDAKVVNNNFIKEYINFINQNTSPKDHFVVFGGVCYEKEPPIDQKYILHYKNGKKREELSMGIRKKLQSYSSFNFVCSRSVMQKVKFNENFTNYGHDDTLFGCEVKKNKIPIYQINNPLLHLGLYNNDIFLDKTRQAIENLTQIIKMDKIIVNEFKLLRLYNKIKYFRNIIALIFSIFNKTIIRNLKSKNPSLFLLDLYKLGYLCTKMKNF